jgi:hypothetical protein
MSHYLRIEFAVHRRQRDEYYCLDQVCHLGQQVQHNPKAQVWQRVIDVQLLDVIEADQLHALALPALVHVADHNEDQSQHNPDDPYRNEPHL